MTLFSVIALFIASLGLLGLVSFTTEQRTKEIGIRKVLGSSVPAIVTLLSKGFVRWILVANCVAKLFNFSGQRGEQCFRIFKHLLSLSQVSICYNL